VLVNNPTGSPIPPNRLQSINTLTTSAIGAGQNSHVTVVDLPFEVADSPPPDAPPWRRQAWMSALGQNALLALAGLLALFGGIFPLLRRLAGVQLAPVAAGVGATPSAAAATGGAGGQEARPLPRLGGAPQDVFSIEAETVQTLVTHDPARTAQVIRGWIAGDRGSLK